LISSGQYISGIVWPSIIEVGINRYGWQATMFAFSMVVLALLPLLAFLRPSPEPLASGPIADGPGDGGRVLGLRPNVTMGLLCVASFLCCVTMALPASHLVAFSSDVGIPEAHAAAMLSVLLGCAFLSRQFWGAFADRFGGLRTVMTGSALQMVTIGAFLLTRNELWLFAIAAALGLGFSGIIPAYSVTIRDLFPSKEASWRIPTVLFTLMSGMAFGSWFGGWIFDWFQSYAAAFGLGVLFNLASLAVIVFLVGRLGRGSTRRSGSVTQTA
jgi:MFS family permease